MKVIDGIPMWGSPVDEGALKQIKNCARTADKVALMADHDKGYSVPIGGVVAYENSISPSGVGYDVACGNKAVCTDASANEVRRNIATLMDDVWRFLSFGVGRKNGEPVDHALFDDPAWSLPAVAPLKEMARKQLGTVGSGNHYVDIFEEEILPESRRAADGMDVDPCVIDAAGNLGADYLACMELAGRYAYAGRDWVCGRVAKILGATITEEVHNHHNFAWRETHGGKDLWVVRKGATPAFPPARSCGRHNGRNLRDSRRRRK